MVNRWRCRHCEYMVWSASGDALSTGVKSHLLDHHGGRLVEEGFQFTWSCPYCGESASSHERSEGLETFRTHLFDHVTSLLESGVHVADEVDGTGDILVLSPLESAGADNARKHFLAPGAVYIIVTTNPAGRLRLIDEQLTKWPSATVVITTKNHPMAGLEDMDFTDVPLEIVRLDKRLGLGGLGETISRVVQEHESMPGKLSVEFDILAEIIEKFTLEEVFKFLHALTSRLESADALSHYYANPDVQSESTINVLDQIFDLRITATDTAFESQSREEFYSSESL